MQIIDLVTELNQLDIRLFLEDDKLAFSAPKGGLTDDLRKKIESNKCELINFLKQHADASLVTLEKIDPQQKQSLSFAQERIWFLCQLEPRNTAFNLHIFFDIHGEIDLDIFQIVINNLYKKHAILRTCYTQTDEGTFQRALSYRDHTLNIIDLEKDEEISLPKLQRQAETSAADTFDLEAGQVTHHTLFRVSEKHHLLSFVIHHIATDGWSMALLAEEIVSDYKKLTNGTLEESAFSHTQYCDFSHWQQQQSKTSKYQKQLEHWKSELKGIEPLNLPCDHERPRITNSDGAAIQFKLDKETSLALKQIAADQQATLYMVLLSIFSTLLYRYSQQDNFCIGTPVAGRPSKELESVVGCFVNMLSIRSEHKPFDTFLDHLDNIKSKCTSAYSNQDIPFEQIVKEVITSRDLSVTPIFQVMFAFQNMPLNSKLHIEGINIQAFAPEKSSSLYDLSLTAREVGNEIQAEFEYKTELFEASTIKSLSENFLRLCKEIIKNPLCQLANLNFVSNDETQKQLYEWNQTHFHRTELPLLHHYFEKQAELSPNALAIKFNNHQLTYRELDEAANQLAHHLIDIEAGPAIGIYIERSLELVIALLATLKAGYAYVPLDIGFPDKRLNHIIGDAEITTVLTHSPLHRWSKPKHLKTISLDLEKTQWSNKKSRAPKVENTPELFNIIYTSGSTGNPKGVIISHKAIINRLLWMQETFPLTHKDNILQKTPYSFDVSVWEIFWPLMFGATTVIAEPQSHMNPDYLANTLQQENISVCHFVPSMLNVFLQQQKPINADKLKRVFCSGEKLSPALTNRFFKSFPNTQLYNLYGPTEASIDVTWHTCSKEDHETPIGKPISNTKVYLLDQQQKLLPVGAIGEIYIAGRNLAEGYLNQPDLSSQTFINNPLPDQQPGYQRLYRTGDLARFDKNGILHFIGRKDNQVKVRGFRIELGEIETHLLSHPAIKECNVIAKLQDSHDRLVAYFIGNKQLVTPDELRNFLGTLLPGYMIPSSFVEVSSWPLTGNAKLDISALPDPEWSDIKSSQFIAPRNAIEEAIANIWCELLDLKKVSINDNFFELGGHSLVATTAINRMQNQFAITIPLADIFQNPTIENISRVIEKAIREKSLLIDAADIGNDDEDIIL